MVAMTITLASGAVKERHGPKSLIKLTDLIGKAGFIVSCVLTVTSGIGYFKGNKHVFSG